MFWSLSICKIQSERKLDLGRLNLQGQNHLSEDFYLSSYSPREQLEEKDAKLTISAICRNG